MDRLAKICPLLSMPEVARRSGSDAMVIEDPIELEDNCGSTVSWQQLSKVSNPHCTAASSLGCSWTDCAPVGGIAYNARSRLLDRTGSASSADSL